MLFLFSSIFFPAAALVIAIYDHWLTFDQEVSLIWTQGLSISKVVFMVNRYCAEGVLLFVAYGESCIDYGCGCHCFLTEISQCLVGYARR